ncbi:hypothetical protein [Mesorhizobium sp. GbtcB19]|uniref:hypothetical protein n=1 Tax=Mesorhizobium sp. GbtcB19 TaxID=2824764 RepID=UPI001C305EE5|nr:hypothetical protein [Mesorhizobium sp. GbtcB19]
MPTQARDDTAEISPGLQPGPAVSSFADVLAVVQRLQPSSPLMLDAILRCLGYVDRDLETAATASRSARSSVSGSSATMAAGQATPLRRREHDQTSQSASRKPVPSLFAMEGGSSEPPQWLYETVAFHAPEIFRPAYRQKIEPLLDPRRSRAILQMISSRRMRVGPLDIRDITRHAAQQKPLARLPRLPAETLRSGVQLLIDIGPSMEPFSQDTNALVIDVMSIVGAGAEIRYFRACPLRGVLDAETGLTVRYDPPPQGRPVLVATDLGIGGALGGLPRSRPAEWRMFGDTLRRRGSAVTVLVPYPQRRLPTWSPATLRVLGWDRSLSVRAVRHPSRGR